MQATKLEYAVLQILAAAFRINLIVSHSTNFESFSSIALHPRKQIMATSSDDCTWKMWSVPNGEIIMTGEGHTDWVSECDFHPS